MQVLDPVGSGGSYKPLTLVLYYILPWLCVRIVFLYLYDYEILYLYALIALTKIRSRCGPPYSSLLPYLNIPTFRDQCNYDV